MNESTQNKAEKEAPFFIVGIGRSGTTLLRLMLHNHPRLAIPYETHFITEYLDRISEFGSIDRIDSVREIVQAISEEPMLKLWDHDFDIDELVNELGHEPSLKDVVNIFYQEYTSSKGKLRWGDKSDYLNRMKQILKIFPDAQFIHICRDGRDVARSVLKLDWGPVDMLQAAEWWGVNVKDARVIGQELGPDRYTEVKFEQLLETPEKELQRLCDFLGEEYSSEMMNYHENADSAIPDERAGLHRNNTSPIKRNRSYAWKGSMQTSHIDLFTHVAGDTLQDLGYEIPEATTPTILLKLSGLRYKVVRKLRAQAGKLTSSAETSAAQN